MKNIMISVLIVSLLCTVSVSAHVPYFEHIDYSIEKPRVIRKNVEQSKAFYSCLKRDSLDFSDDIDVFEFQIKNKGVRVYIEIIVPVVDDFYKEFLPCYALLGPGLSEYTEPLPFEIPDGYGVILMENFEPGEERPKFYEPFGGKSYYDGPIIDMNITKSGTYYVYTWDPYNMGGDYTLVFGKKEIFGFFDILRALIYTPMIRLDMELNIK